MSRKKKLGVLFGGTILTAALITGLDKAAFLDGCDTMIVKRVENPECLTDRKLDFSKEERLEKMLKHQPIFVLNQNRFEDPVAIEDMPYFKIDFYEGYERTASLEKKLSEELYKESEKYSNPEEFADVLFGEEYERLKSIPHGIYLKSVGLDHSLWPVERVKSKKEKLPIYAGIVPTTYGYKIMYKILFQTNDWHNAHRGDNSQLFVDFKIEKGKEEVAGYEFMFHHNRIVLKPEEVWTLEKGSKRHVLVFVAKGSHSTFPFPQAYAHVDPLPWVLNLFYRRIDETILPDTALVPEKVKVIDFESYKKGLLHWVVNGKVSFSSTGYERCFREGFQIIKLPVLRRIKWGNSGFALSFNCPSKKNKDYRLKPEQMPNANGYRGVWVPKDYKLRQGF